MKPSPLFNFSLITALCVAMISAPSITSAADSAPKKKDKSGKKADPKKAEKKKSQYDDAILNAMNHGPFYSGVFNGRNISLKGVAVKLDNGKAGVVFDTLTLRYADGWAGGFIKIGGERTLGCNSFPVGEMAFATEPGPGWAAKGGTFDAARPRYEAQPGKGNYGETKHKGIADGPLPKDWAKWQGIYRQGDVVTFAYTVGNSKVLDQPGLENVDGLKLFTRTMRIDHSEEPLVALIADDAEATGKVENGVALLTSPKGTVAIAVTGLDSAKLSIASGGRVLLTVPKSARAQTVRVVTARIGGDTGKFNAALKKLGKIADLEAATKPGKPIWPQTLTMKGNVPISSEAYVVDTIPVPDRNDPANIWKSWVRCSGFDWFSDGRVAVCSLSGDVWIVSGIDAKLDKVTWKRFASGLYQPLGLKIVKDKVFVLGRDQLTRLHDLNNDGEADYYENFNNDISITEFYHEFCLNLETDSKGNFYFTKGGNLGEAKIAHQGALNRISADGSKLDVVATGLRAPNGMGMSPNDQVSTSDNEGNWVPVCRVDLVKPGAFLGHAFTAHQPTQPTHPGYPLFWIAYNQDNSSGGQVWVPNDKWGPFAGDMLHLSYGKCSLFKTWKQEVDGQVQGGYVRFPLSFESGIMRARFSPFDNQFYAVGLSVWQSSGAKQGAFHRVRYTGRKVMMPTKLEAKKNGVEITFTEPLDPETAKDPGSYAVDQWNYKWAQEYGSKLYSVKDPNQAIPKSLESASGDPVEVKSAKLSNNNRTVFLEYGEPVVPVMEQHIRFNLSDANGKKHQIPLPLKPTQKKKPPPGRYKH